MFLDVSRYVVDCKKSVDIGLSLRDSPLSVR